jgi:hypothetical protein
MNNRAYNILGRLKNKIQEMRDARQEKKIDKDKKELEKKLKEKTMSELYETVKGQVDALIATYKGAISDNQLTLVEAWTLAQHGFTTFVTIAEKLNATGVEKKAVVMAAAEKLYDEVLAPIDIKAIPNFIEPTMDKMARPVYLELISKAVDYLVNLEKKVS